MTRAVRPPSPLQVHRRALLGLSYVVAVVVLMATSVAAYDKALP